MIRAKRQIRLVGDVAFVPLTMGYEAIIDSCDLPLVSGRNWCAMLKRHPDGSIRAVYARSNRSRLEPKGEGGDGNWVWLHKLLLQARLGKFVDHRDGDSLNNRRSNLRESTNAENNRNQKVRSDSGSGVKGVRFYWPNGKWAATISVGGKNRHLGYFEAIDQAKAAYAQAAERHFGEFARTA